MSHKVYELAAIPTQAFTRFAKVAQVTFLKMFEDRFDDSVYTDGYHLVFDENARKFVGTGFVPAASLSGVLSLVDTASTFTYHSLQNTNSTTGGGVGLTLLSNAGSNPATNGLFLGMMSMASSQGNRGAYVMNRHFGTLFLGTNNAVKVSIDPSQVSVASGVNFVVSGGAVVVTPSTVSTTPLTVVALSSQVSNLIDLQDSTGAVITSFGPSGNIVKLNGNAQNIQGHSSGKTFFPSGIITANIGSQSGGANIITNGSNPLVVVPTSAASVPWIVKGAASQSADLQQWQDSTGAVKASVSSVGSIATTGTVMANTAYYSSANAIQIGYGNTVGNTVTVFTVVGLGNTVPNASTGQNTTVGYSNTNNSYQGGCFGNFCTTSSGSYSFAYGTYATSRAGGQHCFGNRSATNIITQQSTNAGSSTLNRDMVDYTASWVDTADATRTSRLTLSTYCTTTAQEGIRIESSSTAVKLGFFGASAVAKPSGDVASAMESLGLVSSASYPGLRRAVKPSTTGWSWVNQTSATEVVTDGIPYLGTTTPLAGSSGTAGGVEARVKTLNNSTNYKVTLGFNYNTGVWGDTLCGLLMRESSSGKLTMMSVTYVAGSGDMHFEIKRYDNPSTYNSNLISYQKRVTSIFGGPLAWFRIVDDGTNRLFQGSADGTNFSTFFTETRTSFLTADQFGYFIQPNSGSPMGITVWHCEEEAYP